MPTEAEIRERTSTQVVTGTLTLTTASEDVSRPDIPSAAHARLQPRRQKCRDLMDGTSAIHAGGEKYLPRYETESDAFYNARRTIAAVYEGFKRTVHVTVDMLLQKDPALGEDMAPELIAFAEDVDRRGTALPVFARGFAVHAVTDGFAGILVDYPRVPNAADLDAEQARRLKLQPYWITIRSDDVLKAVEENISGIRTLTLLIIRERRDERVGSFGLKPRTRYRVYRKTATEVTAEVWLKPDSDGQPTLESAPMGLTGVTDIPWAPFGGQNDQPPLEGLADLNIEHHRIKTGRLSLQERAFVPTPVRRGYTAPMGVDGKPAPEPLRLGPGNTIDIPYGPSGEIGDVVYLSPPVDVLEPSERSLSEVKADMGAMGLAFLTPEKRAAETAEAKRISTRAESASVRGVAQRLKDSLERAFQFTAAYLNIDPPKSGSVTINTDFEDDTLDAQMITALVNAKDRGALDLDTLLDIFEMRKVLPEGADKQAIMRRILAGMQLPEPKPEVDPGAAGAA